jgi:hypothetical protein
MDMIIDGTIKTIEPIIIFPKGVCEARTFSIVNPHVLITPLSTELKNFLDLFLG